MTEPTPAAEPATSTETTEPVGTPDDVTPVTEPEPAQPPAAEPEPVADPVTPAEPAAGASEPVADPVSPPEETDAEQPTDDATDPAGSDDTAETVDPPELTGAVAALVEQVRTRQSDGEDPDSDDAPHSARVKLTGDEVDEASALANEVEAQLRGELGNSIGDPRAHLEADREGTYLAVSY